jgi:alpha-tubulin suppressor-like RCC1 family protein
LIRELENYLKVQAIEKFGFFNMHRIDELIEDSLSYESKQAQIQQASLHSLTVAQIKSDYNLLVVLKDQGAPDVYEKGVQLRNSLRKAARKHRKLSCQDE